MVLASWKKASAIPWRKDAEHEVNGDEARGRESYPAAFVLRV